MTELIVQTHTSISEIGEEAWNALVGDGTPFLEYGFLEALEDTGCVDGNSGWHTAIMTVRERDGDELLGAAPLYVKVHSRGEFVYDWGWADAAARAGIAYYPKGVVAAPMTPATGERLLVAPDADEGSTRRALVGGATEIAKQAGLSSVGWNFITDDEVDFFREIGLPIRTQLQYHWLNEGYETFDDFLARFRSKKRSNIRRERRKLAERGVTTKILMGDDITDDVMRRVFRYYRDTVRKFYWGSQYLNEDFFVQVGHTMRDRLHIVVAEKDGEEFAGTFNLVKNGRLYGRYWGCLDEVEFAHFEVCFYTPIEWACENGIDVFEPGHGGEHKFERGFTPTTTYSAHWLADPRFAAAIRDSLEYERAEVERRRIAMLEESPLKA